MGAFEFLAGAVLGAAASLGADFGIDGNGTGSPPACGKRLIVFSVILLTDDVDVATLSSPQTP